MIITANIFWADVLLHGVRSSWKVLAYFLEHVSDFDSIAHEVWLLAFVKLAVVGIFSHLLQRYTITRAVPCLALELVFATASQG